MSQRKNSSELWNYFKKCKEDGKARCNTCNDILSFKSTIANLKNHLKRKHISLYTTLTTGVVKFEPTINYQPTESWAWKDAQFRPSISKTPNPDLEMSTSSDTDTSTSTGAVGSEEYKQGATLHVQGKECSQQTDALIPKIFKEQKKIIDRDVLKLCIDSFHPFSIVEERSFQKLMRWIPGYKLPSRKNLSNNMLTLLYNETKEKIKPEIAAGCDAICITLDMWTSRNTETYIAVTGHYINKDFKFKTVLLDCCSFSGSPTAGTIAIEIQKITDEWNLTYKVNFAVSDNAPNITNAVTNVLKWDHFGCYAHTLNSILQDALKSFENSISKAKIIIAFFKKNTVAIEKLNQRQIIESKVPKRLIQEVETRWNSTFLMLTRFTELKDEIKYTLSFINNKNLPTISEEEWSAFSLLCCILKPFEEIFANSCEKYVTGSDVIVVTRILKETCEAYSSEDNIQQILSFITKLKANIEMTLGNIEKSEIFSLCTFLDPRYKMTAFSDQTEALKTKRRVQDKVQKMIAGRVQTTTSTAPSSSSIDTASTSAWNVFDKFMADKVPTQRGTPSTKAIKELQMYVDDAILPRKNSAGNYNCPRRWWHAHRNIYPNLAEIYRSHCNVVGTSVPCEQMFSKTGVIISDRRASLKTEKMRQLMFLNVNMDQVISKLKRRRPAGLTS